MTHTMSLYTYRGPVLLFDRCVAVNWTQKTLAISESKARSNLSYRYLRDHGYERGRITLPGIMERGEEG